MAQRSLYIVSPAYDWLFFLGPPMAAFWLGVAISGSRLTTSEFQFFGHEFLPAYLFIGVLIHAHIFIVFFSGSSNKY